MGSRTVVLLGVAACRISNIDVAGKACPCPGGWYCDPATTTCSLTPPSDAVIPDGSPLTYRAAVIADAPLAYWRLGDVGKNAPDEMGPHHGTYSDTCAHNLARPLTGHADTAGQLERSLVQ